MMSEPASQGAGTSDSPTWTRGWLVAAGLYNLAWGAVMVLAPVWSLRMLGVEAPDQRYWPQFWACIGMIVGVYGLGYLIASRNPARHWPIVLVGLLGKVLGPIGLVDAAMHGHLPWSMGYTLLTNDVLWWAPFTTILWRAARAASSVPTGERVALSNALATLRDEDGRSLRYLCDDRPTLVVLLRHSGCTFCKQTLADLARWHEGIRSAGVHLAIVTMSSSPRDTRALARRYGVEASGCYADPDRVLYRALELKRAGFFQLFGPRVIVAGVRAALRGHGVGKLEGDGFQLPGAFVVHRDQVLRAYRHETAGDRPDLQELACPIR